MTDGYLNFDTKINTKGFENGLKNLSSELEKLKSELSKIGIAAASVFSFSQISEFTKECKNLYNVQLEAETRLEAIAKNNLGATDEQIQSLKDYASELQNIGIIGDEIQLSGMQELSTYVENVDNLKPLMSVLDDMLAQQYGFNATAESAVTISTMLGKVLSGQTSALSRYGYTFDEAQENLLKFGTEEQRVATLAEVVSASVGGVNEALAKTPTGQMQQLSNTIGDIKEQFGSAFTQIEVIFLPALQKIADFMAEIAAKAEEFAKNLSKIFGVDSTENYGIGASENIEEATMNQEDFTEAVVETEKVQKNSLATFDELNTISSEKSEEKSTEKCDISAISPLITPVISERSVENAIDGISEKFSNFFAPIKIAWDVNSDTLISNAEYAVNGLKSLFFSVGESVENVWNNGSAERFFSNIFGLFCDVLGVIGDVSAAFENAWNDDGKGEKLIQSYVDKWNELLEILRLFTADFRAVWNNGTGEEICGNLLEIFTNINNTTANLRENFKNAWAENEVGQSIFQSIFDIISDISETAKNVTFSTSEWAKNVDLEPFLTSIDKLLKAVEPFAETIGEGLENFYNDVLLPLASWTIEELIPTFLENFGKAVDGLKSACDAAFPVVKEDFYDKFLKPIADFVAEKTIDAINGLGDAIQWLGNSLDTDQYESIFTVIKGISAIFLVAKAYPIIESAGAAIAGFCANISKLATSLVTFLGSTATLSLSTIFAGVTAFLATFTLTTALLEWFGLDEVLEDFGEKLYDFFNETLPDFCEKTFNGTIEIIANFSDTVWEFFGDLWAKITDIFSEVGEFFKEKFSEAWENITEIFADFAEFFSKKWTKIKNKLSDIGGFFKQKFQSAWDNLTSIFADFAEFFSKKWTKIKNKLADIGEFFKQKFQNAWNNLTSIFSDFAEFFSKKWTKIKNKFSDVGEFFKQKFQNAWNNLTSIFADFTTFFSDKWTEIKNKFSDVGEFFKDKFQNAWDNITSIFSPITAFFSGLWTGISDGAKDGMNWVIDHLNGLLSMLETGINWLVDNLNWTFSIDIPDNVPGIGGMHWGLALQYMAIPQIPKLATGTVVPANYGEFLAVLGDNKRETEVVSPLSTIQKAVENAMNNYSFSNDKPINLTVYLYPNSTAFAREVINVVTDDSRRRGIL